MREIEFLVYIGNKENGNLVVKKEEITSPYRRFNYSKGMRWRVGQDIPQRVARHLTFEFPQVFKIETIEVEEEVLFAEDLEHLVISYEDSFTLENFLWVSIKKILELNKREVKGKKIDALIGSLLAEEKPKRIARVSR